MVKIYLLLSISLAGCNFGGLGFECSNDSQCGTTGRCVANACAFPAVSCPSGFAWDKSAPHDKAGLCAVIIVAAPDLAVPFELHDMAMPSPSPSPQPEGASCHLADDCASGFCADGVCCDSACTGSCVTCAELAHPGHCHAVGDGQPDPHGLCTSTDPCGLDGTCSAGVCALRVRGTVCAPQACSSGVLTLTRTCDGAGTCDTSTTRQCAPYACLPDNSDCASMCTGVNTGCSAPNTCTSGLCGKASNGAACSTPDACISGKCVDGRCCGSSSCATCYACNVSGHEGSCYAIPSSTADPRCPMNPPSGCGYNGTCDGNGGCGFYPAGTECVHPYCNGNQQVIDRQHCAGAGAPCPTGTPSVLLCPNPMMCVYNAGTDMTGCQ